MHAKAACSTWKTILANNTSKTPMRRDKGTAIHNYVKRYVKCADDGQNVTEIRHRLKTWYKFMIVRHPFDR